MTSFGGSDLATFRSRRRNVPQVADALPILHKKPLMDSPLLDLEEGILNKQSYIRTNHYYALPLDCLMNSKLTMSGNHFRLSSQAYVTLMNVVDFPPQPYTPTDALEATWQQRIYQQFAITTYFAVNQEFDHVEGVSTPRIERPQDGLARVWLAKQASTTNTNTPLTPPSTPPQSPRYHTFMVSPLTPPPSPPSSPLPPSSPSASSTPLPGCHRHAFPAPLPSPPPSPS